MRLNKEIREEIISNSYEKSPLPSAIQALAKRSMELSEKVRLDCLGGSKIEENMLSVEKEINMLMGRRGIPEDFSPKKIFNRDSYITVTFPGDSIQLHFSGKVYRRQGADLPSFKGHDGRDRLVGKKKTYEAGHEFVIEREKIINENIDILDKKSSILSQARAVVESCNTVEQLLEKWPEPSALIPKDGTKVTTPLPLSTNVASLNNLIGLPKE